MFRDEHDLLQTLDEYDRLLIQCARGEINFGEFRASYGSFPWEFCLDGHESDQEERELLARHSQRVAVHLDFASEILTYLCAEEDQDKEAYIKAGRLASKAAMPRIRAFVQVRFPQAFEAST